MLSKSDIEIIKEIIRREVDSLREEMNQRFERIDQRFERIDQRFERIDQRFERIESKLKDIEMEVEKNRRYQWVLRDEIESLKIRVKSKGEKKLVFAGLQPLGNSISDPEARTTPKYLFRSI